MDISGNRARSGENDLGKRSVDIQPAYTGPLDAQSENPQSADPQSVLPLQCSDSESFPEVLGSESDSGCDMDCIDDEGEDKQLLDELIVPPEEDSIDRLFHSDDELQNVDCVEQTELSVADGDIEVNLEFDHGVDANVEESDGFVSCDESDDCSNPKKQYPIFNPKCDFKKPIQFKEGMIFCSNDIFRRALRQHAVENGGDYYYLHNDNNKISAYCLHRCPCKLKRGRKRCNCKDFLCGFKVCARRYHADGTFQLKTFEGKHECGWQYKNTKLSSAWLADKYEEHYRDDPSWKLTAFMSTVRRDCNAELKYNQAWKAKRRAMLKTQGDSKKQYARIWDYAATVIKTNPRSTTNVKVDISSPEKPLFQRIYICLQACKDGFKAGCRPIIGVDGCHLRGAYTGQVLVACGKDGNNNIFPVAFAVVEAERRETWGWFLELLMADVGESDPTFISDRQKGLIEELNMVRDQNKLRVCVRHMHNNFKQQWPGKYLKDLVWTAARAYTQSDFQFAMDQIKRTDEKAAEYLMSQNPKTWSRHAFNPCTRSDMLLNNVCESFNSNILPARDQPVLSLCEWIRRYLMSRFVTKREAMSKHKGQFTPNAEKMIEEASQEGTRYCQVMWGGNHMYEVHHKGVQYVVDLKNKTCGCFKWNLTGIPCPHAMCCILRHRKVISDFVDPYYSKDTYMKAYGTSIHPMPNIDQYEKTGCTEPQPPKYIIQPGRPKKHARRREQGEELPGKIKKRVRTAREIRCSNCHQTGHTKKKCTNERVVQTRNTSAQLNLGRPKNPHTVNVGVDRPCKRKYTKRNVANTSMSGQANQQDNVAGLGLEIGEDGHTTLNHDAAELEINMRRGEDGVYDMTVDRVSHLANAQTSILAQQSCVESNHNKSAA